MKKFLFQKNLLLILIADVVILAAALFLSHLFRFDFVLKKSHLLLFVKVLPVVLFIKLGTFYYFDLYRGMWRYTSINDLFNIIRASGISFLIIICIILFSPARFMGFSRSIFIIDFCLTILFISGFRLGIRVYFVHLSQERNLLNAFKTIWMLWARKTTGSKNLIIIGAGDCGEMMYREIRDNPQMRYDIVGFLDDDPEKLGKKIHGVPILNRISGIHQTVKKVSADEILIAIPSANAQQMRTIVEFCKKTELKFQTVPGIGELINGKVSVKAIRDVNYADLLGREAVKLDQEKIGAYLSEHNVLVTGAGGSIGSELCRQICKFKPRRIILFERAESPLYDIELELKASFERLDIIPVLGDTLDEKQLDKTFEKFSPKIVFHAAAYKHVPMLEMQPWKAVENNILGTMNMIAVAKRFQTERFVFVSTDKAVQPTNVMGASKRVTEMLVQSQNVCGVKHPRFMIVRFGNVVGSVGSVIPLFMKQIAKGGPVTVTDPEITRYFMTIPEACQLILQAGAIGHGGEVFLLDMGTPIRISDMAKDLIRLSGFEPDVDVPIHYIGLRLGEKLHEELFTEKEKITRTSHEKIMALHQETCDIEVLNRNIQDLLTASEKQNSDNIKRELQKIVPEYRPYTKTANPS